MDDLIEVRQAVEQIRAEIHAEADKRLLKDRRRVSEEDRKCLAEVRKEAKIGRTAPSKEEWLRKVSEENKKRLQMNLAELNQIEDLAERERLRAIYLTRYK